MESEELIRQGLEIRRKILPVDSCWIADDEALLAAVLAGQQRYEEAEPLLVTSYAVLRNKMGERSPLTLRALDGLVMLYGAWGKAEKAAEYRTLRETGELP